MLRLKNITKNYQVGTGEIEVLKGLNISFRKNEFVSILGPSGCGKTTTLNIVGGLDKYTSGDLIIAGKSTKDFKDSDWDTYRNQRIGFVFQSYNLIPHQTVLGNVELSLTISGVSKEERIARSMRALDRVGLKGEYYKKPNQLSGGQCQRVAIARALVNEPDILLADEPTGALDSKTSVQIMELIKEISKDKLVIMVTHNAEIAEQYSTRIVRLVDGEVVEDSAPYSEEDEIREIEEEKKKLIELQSQSKTKTKKVKQKKAKMSWWTAFKLSLRNLFTKKGRTILTSFAGSIGIIGISLILAVSQGTTGYINHVQESTLSSYPITIETESMDLTSLMESFMGLGENSITHDKDAIYENPILIEMANSLTKTGTSKNDLKSFKTFLDSELKDTNSKLYKAVSGVQYTYDLDLQIYTKDPNGVLLKSDTGELMTDVLTKYVQGLMNNGSFTGGFDTDTGSLSAISSFMPGASGMWQELLSGTDGNLINKVIYDQYELIDGGSWPNDYNEVVLVVNENNEISDLTLYALGLISKQDVYDMIDASSRGETIERNGIKYTYEKLREMKFRTVLPADKYQNRGDGVYIDTSDLLLESIYERSLELKITGIIRPKADVDAPMLSSGIAYTKLLTEHVIDSAEETAVVKAQKSNPKVDVLTGLPFKSQIDQMTDDEKATEFKNTVSTLSESEKAALYLDVLCVKAEQSSLSMYVAGFKQQFITNPTFKAQIIDRVLTEYANQLGVEKEVLQSYLGQATDEELLIYVEPVFEIMAKQTIRGQEENKISSLSDAEKSVKLYDEIGNGVDVSLIALYYDELTEFSSNTYEDNLVNFGCLDLGTPFTVNIYTSSFENKDVIASEISAYNKSVGEEQQIHYNDYVGLLMSSVTQIIDAITYVLIAFVSISLIVSSIMIGVITLISVQERTKEIGILRSLGASKKDVSSLFNAETIIIGFTSGLCGVLITYLLCIPINIILYALTGLATLKAVLPINAAIILVLISIVLNWIAGLIPSSSAAKKDPVIALRTE